MTPDPSASVRLDLTEPEAHELYRLLTDERPRWVRILSPLAVSDRTIARLHIALLERTIRNKL
jgi:hypothetical protein